NGGYMQGIFILAEEGGIGTEFVLEADILLAGVILGRGCVELGQWAVTVGAVFVDGNFSNELSCDGDPPLALKDMDTRVRYSTCATQRALGLSGLGSIDPSTAPLDDLAKLGNRSFQEVLR
ncbi:MAG: hypothetical protein O7I93_15230, partial [Gemmatimonadetes bacterium]|nr:hypothetical protein [Gemmatimonadota bacterium]